MFRVRRHKTVNDPVAVVNRFVDAANRHDADGIARCLHPDFESIQPVYPSRNFRGSDQVRRNWQSIFESEPGFRLSLVRASATDGTVWVELHGAGKDVEVAGVFIMGVEDELVRWARVYSAVIEQPAVVMDDGDQAPKVVAVAADPQAEAEELRRMIEAGRVAAMGDTSGPKAESEFPETEAGVTEATEAEAGVVVDGDGLGSTEELVSAASPAESDAEAIDAADRSDAGDAAESADSEGEGVQSESAEADAPSDVPQTGEATDDSSTDDSATDATSDSPSAVASSTDGPSASGPSSDSPTDAARDTATDDRPEPSTDQAGGTTDREGDATDGAATAVPVSPAVAAVQALADGNRSRLAQESLREPHDADESPDEPEPEPVVELDDAARVRAAARAATSKAAGLSAPKPAGPAKGAGRKSGRGGKPPRRG